VSVGQAAEFSMANRQNFPRRLRVQLQVPWLVPIVTAKSIQFGFINEVNT